MADLLLVGSFTRDRIHLAPGRPASGRRASPARWTQPGGGPWHAGLALAQELAVTAVAQAGPWAREFALPGLRAAGVQWAGPTTEQDTVFVNRYDGLRRQMLLSRARPLTPRDLTAERVEAAALSPLFPADVDAAVLSRLRDRGVFVGLDVQGLLRAVDSGRRVRTVWADIGRVGAATHALKFDRNEFDTAYPSDDWRAAGSEVARSLGVEVLITSGAEGAFLATPATTAEAAGLVGEFDVTGAGDIFLAAYVHARAGGVSAGDALEQASAFTQALLRRRASGVDGMRMVRRLRHLQTIAMAAARSAERCPPARWLTLSDQVKGAPFAARSALRRTLEAHLTQPLERRTESTELSPGGLRARGAATLSGCWALWSQGWPADPGLGVDALDRALATERNALQRLRAALL